MSAEVSAALQTQKNSTAAPEIEEIRTPPAKARLTLVPKPEALLHPRATEALVLAFRPLSWGR